MVWTGEVYHSGTRHGSHWRTAGEWQGARESEVGPMVSPAIWMPGTVSRTGDNVLATPYTVLDFDGFDGVKPSTPAEIKVHVAASFALVRWLREGLQWKLAAIVHSGNKSIHAWFHTPPPEVLKSLHGVAEQFGVDAGLIGRGEHPCRLPGQVHSKSGNVSRVLWLQEPIS
ncbi:MAG: hypothetical protein H7A49_03515 [Akkermansiaceae bacterium]|nr:hypothetical protein [Akkermansiaceae bacterium]MCP5542958.1 hypothetical protein [Akkermansiaceae bacterium]